MMKVEIKLEERSYPIYITDSFSDLGNCLGCQIRPGISVAVIADENTGRIYSDGVMAILGSCGYKAYRHIIGAGESYKDLDTVKAVYNFLIGRGFDRSSAVVALGGGVTGDIAGFAASTYMRGIRYIQVPTTLLAQSDSSVGGKVGVDFEGIKNIIGSFYQPEMVYINVSTLKSLPDCEMRSGLAEVIKHGLIGNAGFVKYIEDNMIGIFKRDTGILQYLSRMNCTIKGRIVGEDERESGLRAVLNFGHTIGHAIESCSGYSMKHGECVAIGMAGAFRISARLGLADGDFTAAAEGVLLKAGLPVRYPAVIEPEKVLKLMFCDKKTSGGKLNMVLPVRIGEVILYPRSDRESIDSGIVTEVLHELRESL